MNAIFHRTSVRKYKDREVEPAKLELILRAAMAAPSAGNQQPWEFYVVTGKARAELAACSPYAGCAKNAPVVIAACYRKNIPMPEYAEIDLSASLENLLIEADDLGLGAVWLGIAPLRERMDAVGRVIGLPEGLEAFALVALGYPAEDAKQEFRFDPGRIHYIKE